MRPACRSWRCRCFGMGVFLMTRKQLLGLKERVERFQAAGGVMPEMPPAAEPAPVSEPTPSPA